VFRVLRFRLLPFALVALLSSWDSASAAEPKPTPTPAAKKAKEKEKPKRVFTNDDLEATKDKPSAVQDLTATGMVRQDEPVRPAPQASEPEAPATPEDPRSEEERRIDEVAATVKDLDDRANALLWQYLQSTDTYEIMRLKAEQQEVLDQLAAARAELARLKGEPVAPRAEPTRQPG
jgi:hypothetical protein